MTGRNRDTRQTDSHAAVHSATGPSVTGSSATWSSAIIELIECSTLHFRCKVTALPEPVAVTGPGMEAGAGTEARAEGGA